MPTDLTTLKYELEKPVPITPSSKQDQYLYRKVRLLEAVVVILLDERLNNSNE